MSNILITGGSGFFGSLLVNELLKTLDNNIYVLLRAKNKNDAGQRIYDVITKAGNVASLPEESKERIHACIGDITRKNLGLDKKEQRYLVSNIDKIYHSAASTDLNLPLERVRKVNVEGTRNVLDFAMLCKNSGGLKKVNYISTAYVAGNKRCRFTESELNINQGFNNTYEQSKYEAEKLIEEYRRGGLNVDVFRPSIMLGRYDSGFTSNFKMFYQPLHFFSLGLFDKIPALKDSRANIINVDIAAKAICLIAESADEINKCYHITSPYVPDFEYILDIASAYFGFKKPTCIPLSEINMAKEYSAIKRKMLDPYTPYFNYLTEFDMTNTLTALRDEDFSLPEFDRDNLEKLFKYCDDIGFIKRKKKNVSVSGKVAVVTGGSRGIGRAIVLELASQGADVAFNYLKSKDAAEAVSREVEAKGRKTLIFQCDVKDLEDMKNMIKEVKEKLGGLDIIVNNAGILKDKAMMLMEEDDWGDVIATNLSGTFNLTRAAIVTLMKQKKGSIINITSVAGVTGSPRQVNYSASKAGVLGLTKSLAKEVGPYNIRVNAVAPGYIDTDMVAGIKDDLKNLLFERIPLKRFGKSEEVAKTVVFLASDEARYITGQVMLVDGGLAI